MIHHLTLPLSKQDIDSLHIGDEVFLTGMIYTARDAAHMAIRDILQKGETLPFDLQDIALYYCGPCPTPPGKPIGSCGPTTSGRMDDLTPMMLTHGVRCLIGKGPRSAVVSQALQENKAVYLAAPGGAGALLAQKVLSCKVVAFEDLGPEAVYALQVEDFPTIVAADCHGGDLYQQAVHDWRQTSK